VSGITCLPQGFSVLEPFVPRWSLELTAQRAARRTESTAEERDAFFAAAAPMLDTALDHLDARSLGSLSPENQRLMNLMLSLAHVALAVEVQGPDEANSASWRDRMRIGRSTADQGGAACSN
jgi:hypothetical protein